MVLFVVISITRTMIGPAQRPLTIALQKRALDGTDVAEIERQSEQRYRWRSIHRRRGRFPASSQDPAASQLSPERLKADRDTADGTSWNVDRIENHVNPALLHRFYVSKIP